MTEQHPITPPPKQVAAWRVQWCNSDISGVYEEWLAACAAQWGADQAFEACLKELESIPSQFGIPFGKMAGNALRAARRPKLPSLKQRALEAMREMRIEPCIIDGVNVNAALQAKYDTIILALEQLDG